VTEIAELSIPPDRRREAIVPDANGHALAYVYFEDEPGRRSAAHLMTRDEARSIAAKHANLPSFCGDELRREILYFHHLSGFDCHGTASSRSQAA